MPCGRCSAATPRPTGFDGRRRLPAKDLVDLLLAVPTLAEGASPRRSAPRASAAPAGDVADKARGVPARPAERCTAAPTRAARSTCACGYRLAGLRRFAPAHARPPACRAGGPRRVRGGQGDEMGAGARRRGELRGGEEPWFERGGEAAHSWAEATGWQPSGAEGYTAPKQGPASADAGDRTVRGARGGRRAGRATTRMRAPDGAGAAQSTVAGNGRTVWWPDRAGRPPRAAYLITGSRGATVAQGGMPAECAPCADSRLWRPDGRKLSYPRRTVGLHGARHPTPGRPLRGRQRLPARPATSPRPSTSWTAGCAAATGTWCCWARPAPARAPRRRG